MRKSEIPAKTRKEIDAYYEMFMDTCMLGVVHGHTSEEYLETRKKLFSQYIDMMNKMYVLGARDSLMKLCTKKVGK